MNNDILILSADAVFARMLELELSMMQFSVSTAEHWTEGDFAGTVLLDLDSAEPPKDSRAYGEMIGFTRSSALFADEAGRQCSLILRRPFEMRLLRREVLRCMNEHSAHTEPKCKEKSRSNTKKSAELLLDVKGRSLGYGERSVGVSPREMALLQCLLEHRGMPVSRTRLAEVIGTSEANKTEVYICYLRRKLEMLQTDCRIRTVRGLGYQIE